MPAGYLLGMAITLPPPSVGVREATHSMNSSMSRYFRSCQTSFCSAGKAPIRRKADSSFGKMRMTRSRRRISSLSRSYILVVRSLRRYFSGRAMTAMASSNPSSIQATAFAAVLAKCSVNSAS